MGARKWNDSSKEIVKRYDKDVLRVNVDANKVVVVSDAFGISIVFRKVSRHVQENKETDTPDGVKEAIEDIFYNPEEKAIAYVKQMSGFSFAPILIIDLNDGYSYTFEVAYGEIYDKRNNKWVRGNAYMAENYDDDKVRNRLRHDISKFCDKFEYELQERLKFSKYDPWRE